MKAAGLVGGPRRASRFVGGPLRPRRAVGLRRALGFQRRSARRRLSALALPGALPGPAVTGRFVALGCGLAGVTGGFLLAGPVGSAIAGVYAVLGALAWARGRAERRSAAARTAAVDAIGTLAADLRAGLPAARALAEALPALRVGGDPAVARAARLVGGAMQVADRLGAPLAVLLDRVDADLRAAERCRVTVAAQTAGARATAWLLAALPLGGVGLGYGMGGDPGRVLLHTPLGAGCALGALLLQCAGLAWTARMCRTAVAGST